MELELSGCEPLELGAGNGPRQEQYVFLTSKPARQSLELFWGRGAWLQGRRETYRAGEEGDRNFRE